MSVKPSFQSTSLLRPLLAVLWQEEADCLDTASPLPIPWFLFQPLSVHDWTLAFLMRMHLLSHFSATLAQDRLSECDQGAREKSLEILCRGRGSWTRATERTDREIHSLSHWAIMTRATESTAIYMHIPLSYRDHDPGHGEGREWDLFILSQSHHDPGQREDRQWDTLILPLSYHDPDHGESGEWDSPILSQSCHDWPLPSEYEHVCFITLLKLSGKSRAPFVILVMINV